MQWEMSGRSLTMLNEVMHLTGCLGNSSESTISHMPLLLSSICPKIILGVQLTKIFSRLHYSIVAAYVGFTDLERENCRLPQGWENHEIPGSKARIWCIKCWADSKACFLGNYMPWLRKCFPVVSFREGQCLPSYLTCCSIIFFLSSDICEDPIRILHSNRKESDT